MKFLKQGLCLGLVAAGLAAGPMIQAQAGTPAAEPSIVTQMRDQADGNVKVATQLATGKLGFIRANGADADLMPGRSADSKAGAAAKASAYLDKFSAAFGAARGELVQSRTTRDNFGWNVVYTQRYRGVDVFGSMIKANLDNAGNLTSVNGYAAPGLKLSTDARYSAAEAGARAVGIVKADPAKAADGNGKADTTGVKAASTALVVYRIGAIKGEAGKAVLAYQVEVTNARNIRDMVFVDANTNKVVNRYSMVNDALDRELYETSPSTDPVWVEGDDFPGDLNEDQQNLVNSAGESYWLFQNTFGRDSYDDDGATMKTVNNDPRINCPNANWNGVTTNYCDGVTSDDVVSHEWGHAYTEYTSGLIYQYQSGALNESYSDVWGETLDLINGREDEGEDNSVRTTEACDPTAPAKLEVTINSPANVAGPCTASEAGFGPGFDTTGVTTDVVVATDEANGAGPSSTDGCTAYTNAGAVAGKYAYVDRGSCSFQIKVDNAEDAGATGIVVGNNAPGLPISMSGVSDLPGLMITQSDGARVKSAGTVNMTIAAEDTSSRPEANRWLVGEKSTAFGGAIRDMWNPTCYGDPGKVTDAEYNCDPNLTDSGGVHSNSGVPNHAYALVTDGGTSNGTTVTALGLDKAANIWYHAQTNYLTPTSNFVDAANAFEASCADLVGEDINVVTTETDATPTLADPITTGDCGSVTAAIAATEMRTPPTQCNFQPLLKQGAPSPCGPGFNTGTVYNEKFEDGLVGWEQSQQIAHLGGYDGGFGAPWEATASAPGDHPGGVAYGPAPDRGDCSGDGINDFSSRDSLISPSITMPTNLVSPRLSFDHYIATEAGYDGGNVKISVDEGPFTVIPASAYVFNPTNTTLFTLGGGNSNPLAGQPAFSGTDGGEVKGSWGTSLVDLAAAGVSKGSSVRFRFDIGRDGCGGVDGWYVDNVKVTICSPVIVTPPGPPTPPGPGGKVDSETKLKVKPQHPAYKQNLKAKIKVTADEVTPTGKVKLFADGKKVAKGKLNSFGKLVLKVTRNLKPGKYKMVAKYLGSDTVNKSKDKVRIRVAKRGRP